MTVERTELDPGIRVLRLARPPVNALDPDLAARLVAELDQAERDGVDALVLAGGPKIFSAGLDVPALLQLDRDGMRAFWRDFLGIAARLARFPAPVAAAIDGHSPAGGAVIALCCDYRVMARGAFRIGLNEVEVGLPVPASIQAILRRQVGARQAERLLVAGAMLESEQAHAIGFVDALCEPGGALDEALAWCRGLLALPRRAMLTTRTEARRDIAAIFDEPESLQLETMTEAWFGEETQTTMTALVERLKSGR